MKSLVEENYPKFTDGVFRDPILFGDYRTAMEESEPRLYEDIQDYEASKALFQEVIDFCDVLIAPTANFS